jgi:hypothetical protein
MFWAASGEHSADSCAGRYILAGSLRVLVFTKKVNVPHNILEIPEGGRVIILHSLDLRSRMGCVASTTPQLLYFQESPGTHCTGGWVCPRVGLEVREISHKYRDSTFFLAAELDVGGLSEPRPTVYFPLHNVKVLVTSVVKGLITGCLD